MISEVNRHVDCVDNYFAVLVGTVAVALLLCFSGCASHASGEEPTPMRVLFVLDFGGPDRHDPRRTPAFYPSREITDYLWQHSSGVRVYDTAANVCDETLFWRQAMARHRSQHPWIVIYRGVNVLHEGPLPRLTADVLALLKKQGQ